MTGDFTYRLELNGDQILLSFNLRAWRLLLSRPVSDTLVRFHLQRLVTAANMLSASLAIVGYDHDREQFVATAQDAHERALGRVPLSGEGESLSAALRALADRLETTRHDIDRESMRQVYG